MRIFVFKRGDILARKPKITEEMQKRICECIAEGMTNKLAVEGLVDEATFYRYINKGAEDIENGKNTVYSNFYKSVKTAEKEFAAYHLKNIEKASEYTWQASAWALERRFPNEYGRRTATVEVSGTPNGEPIKTEGVVQIYIPDNGRDKK